MLGLGDSMGGTDYWRYEVLSGDGRLGISRHTERKEHSINEREHWPGKKGLERPLPRTLAKVKDSEGF